MNSRIVRYYWKRTTTLQWRHSERNGVSNHQPNDCLLNHLFKAQVKENIKAPRHWLLWGEFIGDRIPRTKGQWRGKLSIWLRHHGHIARYIRDLGSWLYPDLAGVHGDVIHAALSVTIVIVCFHMTSWVTWWGMPPPYWVTSKHDW